MHVEGDRGGGREGRGEERKEGEKNKGSYQVQTCPEKRVGDTSDIAGKSTRKSTRERVCSRSQEKNMRG